MHPPPDPRGTATPEGGGEQSIRRAGGIDTIVDDRCDIEQRCLAGTACVEVVARLHAADRSALEGYRGVAEQLRITAARFAEEHRYGLTDGGAP